MTKAGDQHETGDDGASPEPTWKRRQRLAEVFGDPLPDTTRDERDPAEQAERRSGDTWLKEQVPPHHGS